MTNDKPINLFEYEAMAPQHLSQMALDYYASGAGDEVTLRNNRTAFEAFKLRPRMLVDVSQRDLSTEILGEPVSLPILIAPRLSNVWRIRKEKSQQLKQQLR